MLRLACFVSLLACCFAGLAPGQRIVGGYETDIARFPHQISMRRYGSHRCGGSILTPNVILSAGHCVADLNQSNHNLTIVAGATRLSEHGVSIPVHRFILHENYTSAFDYDVTMLILKGRLLFSDLIKPIALATVLPPAGSVVTVSGWGVENSGDTKVPDRLKATDLQLNSQRACRIRNLALITERMICASVPGGGTDACQGDSGGPLIHGNVLVGVVSWGFGCDVGMFPGVYANVPVLRDWIIQTTRDNEINFA